MKQWLITQLKKILKVLAIWTLKKYQPGIIAVTGSVGKTSTKEAIFTVLCHFRRTRASASNFNNELGLPLTVLGNWPELKGILFWPKVILRSLRNLIFSIDYPEILVLEYAADRPGDLDYLLAIAKPQIAVVTTVGKTPAHVEFYDGPEAIIREKVKVVKALPIVGFAVLNFDDQTVLNMMEFITTPVFTYGFGDGAQVKISNFENKSDQGRPAGIVFKLTYNGRSMPVKIEAAFGKAQAYAAAAATCVGLGFGLNFSRIAESLTYYRALKQRMKFLMGIKDTYLIDDSYNASPLSMRVALDAIKDFKAKRKVGVLGDMLELGRFSAEAHEDIGKVAARIFNVLITVGPMAKLIAEAARDKGMAAEKVFSFETVDEVKLKVLGLLKSGDLVLIKASRGIGLDKIVEEIRYRN